MIPTYPRGEPEPGPEGLSTSADSNASSDRSGSGYTKFRNTGTREPFKKRTMNIKPPRGKTFPEWWVEDPDSDPGQPGQKKNLKLAPQPADLDERGDRARTVKPSKEQRITADCEAGGRRWVHEIAFLIQHQGRKV